MSTVKMALSAGDKLGPYKILSAIGKQKENTMFRSTTAASRLFRGKLLGLWIKMEQPMAKPARYHTFWVWTGLELSPSTQSIWRSE